MRWIAKFEKAESLRFLSHLDLMRAMQRALRRSGLPVRYSQGFNPHQILSFASALPVGGFGSGEVMDVGLTESADPEQCAQQLNAVLPCGLHIYESVLVEESYPSLMSVVQLADYTVSLRVPAEYTENLKTSAEPFLAQKSIKGLRKGKSGVSEQELKGLIMRFVAEENDNRIWLKMQLRCGSTDNVKPETALNAYLRYCGAEDAAADVRCCRDALWAQTETGTPCALWELPIKRTPEEEETHE